MKKIFLVVSHAVFEYEDCGTRLKAFETKEKAQEYFNYLVEVEKREIENLEWEIPIDTDIEFEAYEDGDYTRNHTWVEIRELKVE